MKTTILLAAVAATILPANGLNLVKRDNPKVMGMQIHRRSDSKIFTGAASLRRRSSTVSQILDNFEDGSLYFANVTMGTPAQNFRFHLDTGSSDLWTNVASSTLCTGTSSQSSQSGQEACAESGTYSANDSSTYKYISSAFSIEYADGSGASGDYVSDTVRIGGIDLLAQQFGTGYESTSDEGVMGIGYAKLEAQYQNAKTESEQVTYPNIPQSMVSQGYINSNAYSLWLDDIYSATGNILFGGVDTEKYQGSLRTLDIVQEAGGYLEMLVTLDSISMDIGGKNISAMSNSTTVLLDSGTTLTYLPEDTATTIYEAVDAEYSSRYGLAFVDCALANSTDTLAFNFAGKVINVSMPELVLEGGISDSLDCTFGIAPLSSSTTVASDEPCILGDSFIRNAYIVYDLDNNQISLAQTNNQSTTSNIMEITTGSNAVPDVTGTAAPASTSLGTNPTNEVSNVDTTSSSSAAMATSVSGKWIAGIGAVVAAML